MRTLANLAMILRNTEYVELKKIRSPFGSFIYNTELTFDTPNEKLA
jgi:hypothetical protein